MQIHADQGHNFQSVLFKDVCWLLDVEKTLTTVLEPTIKWDGEMAILNIVGYVNQICRRSGNGISYDHLALAYRSATHERTGLTTYELTFGHFPPVPVT